MIVVGVWAKEEERERESCRGEKRARSQKETQLVLELLNCLRTYTRGFCVDLAAGDMTARGRRRQLGPNSGAAK